MRVPAALLLSALLAGCRDDDKDKVFPSSGPAPAPIEEPDPVPTGPVFHVSPSGDDAAPGTAAQPWKTIAKAAATAVAGDTVFIHEGVYAESLVPANSGAGENARIEFRAPLGETVILEGGQPLAGWTLEGDQIYRKTLPGPAYGVFEDTYETKGARCAYWNMFVNNYGSNPNQELHDFDPAHDYYGGIQDDAHKMHDRYSQYKFSGGVLRVRTSDGASPDAHDVRAAVRAIAIDLSNRDYVTVRRLQVRRWKIFAITDYGSNLRFVKCDFRYAGTTGMWVTQSPDVEILQCVFQGAGSWTGHYDDCIMAKGSPGLVLDGNDFSYGGHGGVVLLDGSTGATIRKNVLHTMGGSLMIIKRGSDGALLEDNVYRLAPGLAQVRVHKTPHAALQLSGSNHGFRRNLIHDCGAGLMISCSDTQVALDNVYENVTIAGIEQIGILLEGYQASYSDRLRRNYFRNVIVSDCGYLSLRLDLPGGETGDFWDNHFQNCDFWGAQLNPWGSWTDVATAQSKWPTVFQNCFEADPLLAPDFHLSAGSPCIDAGMDVGDPWNGAAPDVGCYEY
jgi:hypothetical protein